jgi:hypothetical protein
MRPEPIQPDCLAPASAPTGELPAGTPAWITPELIEATRKVWEPRYGRRLSSDEAITIIRTAGRLFELLSRE